MSCTATAGQRRIQRAVGPGHPGPRVRAGSGTGWGGVDYADVMACVETACQRFDWIDPSRIGILGGSYGGFMTSWAIGRSRFLAACSEHCNNLLTMEHAPISPASSATT